MADSGLGKAQSKCVPKRRMKGLCLRKKPKSSVQGNIKSMSSQPVSQLGARAAGSSRGSGTEVEC